MKRVQASVLVALTIAGTTGCTGSTAERGGFRTSETSPHAGTNPTMSQPSPSRSAVQPAGEGCPELLSQVRAVSGVAWRLDEGSSQATGESLRSSGSRSCVFVASSTDKLPPAIMAVSFYRPNPAVDTPDKVRERAAEAADDCGEPVAEPAPGLTMAVQCLKQRGAGFFDVRTVLSTADGFVRVLVSVQPTTAPSSTLTTRVRNLSREAADIARQMI